MPHLVAINFGYVVINLLKTPNFFNCSAKSNNQNLPTTPILTLKFFCTYLSNNSFIDHINNYNLL